MRYLKSKRGLKVEGLGDGIFLAWIPNYYGIMPPKLIYKYEIDGELKFVKVQGQFKTIGVNSLIISIVVLILKIIDSNGLNDIISISSLLIGVFVFMILLHIFLIRVTKWRVDKQKQ